MALSADLRQAARAGYLLIASDGAEPVSVEGRVLRFGLALDPEERARSIDQLLATTVDTDTHERGEVSANAAAASR